MTMVTICDFANAPSSKVMTIALFPIDHVDDEVIALTISPTKASICAIRKLCWTEFIGLESTHHGGAPCESWHSSGVCMFVKFTMPLCFETYWVSESGMPLDLSG